MQRIDGLRLALQLVTPGDAAYIHSLRTNSHYNTHLSTVTGTIEDQRAWIERYKEREAAGTEYYYRIERRADGLPCGVVRLYDIVADCVTWGSWILDANKPPKAALESAVLSFGVAFAHIGVAMAQVDVRKQNSRALNFYRRFGMREIGDDDLNIYFEYTRVRFEADLPSHMKSIHETEQQ